MLWEAMKKQLTVMTVSLSKEVSKLITFCRFQISHDTVKLSRRMVSLNTQDATFCL